MMRPQTCWVLLSRTLNHRLHYSKIYLFDENKTKNIYGLMLYSLRGNAKFGSKAITAITYKKQKNNTNLSTSFLMSKIAADNGFVTLLPNVWVTRPYTIQNDFLGGQKQLFLMRHELSETVFGPAVCLIKKDYPIVVAFQINNKYKFCIRGKYQYCLKSDCLYYQEDFGNNQVALFNAAKQQHDSIIPDVRSVSLNEMQNCATQRATYLKSKNPLEDRRWRPWRRKTKPPEPKRRGRPSGRKWPSLERLKKQLGRRIKPGKKK